MKQFPKTYKEGDKYYAVLLTRNHHTYYLGPYKKRSEAAKVWKENSDSEGYYKGEVK